jgi:hypothetical protein
MEDRGGRERDSEKERDGAGWRYVVDEWFHGPGLVLRMYRTVWVVRVVRSKLCVRACVRAWCVSERVS